ncbi:amino acid/peptide transporter (Peptide:H+ symporter) [Bacillus cereus VD133]|uniref:Amino acid/peptide transporter (Peptide:H+ symporter) n=1 Tax=Bacillus cereus VD133 TaxID=1053233 RepID=A0A9W5UZN6_BACCE|nr:peptide MFS transporter [Bacillus cereus]EOO25749.1 amino acid/peptide transporter (Peptide:H+ symporter) [Bacillus cereus VD133]
MSVENKETIHQSILKTGFLGHPKGLFTLSFTEFWERFSYYGMRAILIYFMYYQTTQGGLGIDKNTAASVMAIYGSLVYMSSVAGGWVADRLLGNRKTVFYGGILIMIGHIILTLPSSITTLFISMAFIIFGTGFLKSNVSSVVGSLYSPTDNRRDSGFSIFYMGINLGAFIAPFIVGSIGQEYNFPLGFGIAAVGMLLGLIVFSVTERKYLGSVGMEVPNPLTPNERKQAFKKNGIGVLVILLLGLATISTGILTINRFTLLISILGIIIPTCYFIFMYRSQKITDIERSRILAYIPLFIAATMFFAIEEQGSIILAIYADKRTQLHYGGLELEASWFQSLNPLFIILFSPIFAWIWIKLGKRQPSTSKKFALGLFLAGVSFIIMIIPAYMNGTESLVSPMWLVLSFFIVVIGELCLSPVGLSITSKLAPAAFASQTMSLWFLSNAAAQAINAQLVQFYNPQTEIIYFGVIGMAAIVLGGLLIAFSSKIQSLMRGLN